MHCALPQLLSPCFENISYCRRASAEVMSVCCVKVDKKSVTQCAKDAKECGGLRYAYFQCKRGQVDARNRITGNKGY